MNTQIKSAGQSRRNALKKILSAPFAANTPAFFKMLRKTHYVLTLSLFFFSASCSDNDGIALHEQKIKTGQSGFTILMPQSPSETVQSVNTPAGTIVIHLYYVNLEKAAFAVSFNDLPEKEPGSSADPQQVLASSRDGFLQTTGGKLASDKELKSGKYPCREYEVEAGEMVYFTRAYLVKKRLYQVMIALSTDKRRSGIVPKYLDSFRLDE